MTLETASQLREVVLDFADQVLSCITDVPNPLNAQLHTLLVDLWLVEMDLALVIRSVSS